MIKKKELPVGTKRVKCEDLNEYIRCNKNWKQLGDVSFWVKTNIKYYLDNDNFNFLVDSNVCDFLKGCVMPCGTISGGRIKYLPNGKKLARGGFSLFAKNLKFNVDSDSNWAVMYENVSGLKTYLYDEDNVALEREKKAKLVDKFIKFYPVILRRLEKDLIDKKEVKYLGLYTLLRTFMRVGNLEYYLHLGHRGLTTLQKRNIFFADSDSGKSLVIFDFLGKDGVPQHISCEFPSFYIDILKGILDELYVDDFVFADSDGVPIHSAVFSKLMFEYTGEHFYPHIVRSYYADLTCSKFISSHMSATKKQVQNVFLDVAKVLGHKKFDKEKGSWVVDSKVTVLNYIRPEYSLKMQSMIKNN